MTTCKQISDKKFSITFATSNYDKESNPSEKFHFLGLEWHMDVYRDKKHHVRVVCDRNANSCWSVQGKYGLWILSSENRKYFDYTFKNEENSVKHSLTLAVGIVEGSCVTLHWEVEILSITGNQALRSYDFNNKDASLNDMVFNIDGKLFHANKAMLAKCSPVFYDLFYKNHETEVKINDIKQENFETFLSFMYLYDGQINPSKVGDLLLLAFQYQVTMITDNCETYLLSTKKVNTAKKLEYAVVYQMKFLENHCLESLSSVKKIQEVCKDVDLLHQTTKDALMAKLVGFMKAAKN